MTMLSVATRRGGLESKGLCDIPYKQNPKGPFLNILMQTASDCHYGSSASGNQNDERYKKFNPPYTVESTCMKKEFVFIVVLLPH
jgi:hypothetical protein